MIELSDGRGELWQWDTGRRVSVDAPCTEVHFAVNVYGSSFDVPVNDGEADIPDILLQTDGNLNVWGFVGTAGEGYTRISKVFRVNRRNKPAGYTYTPTAQISLETIRKEIEETKTKLDGKIGAEELGEAVADALGYTPADAKIVEGLSKAIAANAEAVGKAISFEAQTLTDEQKAQVRTNIGAAAISGGYVNIFDPSENTVDKALDNTTILSSGALRTDTHHSDRNYFTTGKITVEPNVEYVMSKAFWPVDINDINRGRCYSATDAALEALTWEDIGDGDVKFTTPLNSAYVRFAIRKDTMLSFSDGSPFEEVIAYFNSVFELKTYSVSGGNGEISGGSIYPLKDKVIVNFGDSIFGNARPPQDISTMLAKMTGATVKNCAFGGCRMGVHTGHWDAFSMYRLAYAIANNDYSLQDEAINYDDRTSYAEEPLTTLKETDFSKVDIVTIAYGTNDWGGSNPLDNTENLYDTTTVCGALRYSIESLLTAFPQLRIFVLLPTYRFWMDADGAFTEDSETRTNNLEKTTGEYCQAIKVVAEEYNLPVIDNYKQLGINKFNRTQYFPANDGSHHNENGRKVIAAHLAKKLW